jgi:hypothetical protein
MSLQDQLAEEELYDHTVSLLLSPTTTTEFVDWAVQEFPGLLSSEMLASASDHQAIAYMDFVIINHPQLIESALEQLESVEFYEAFDFLRDRIEELEI